MNNTHIRQTGYDENGFQERLLQQVDTNPEIYTVCGDYLNDGIIGVCAEDAVPPEFSALYWKILDRNDFSHLRSLQPLMICSPQNLEAIVNSDEARKNPFALLKAEESARILLSHRFQMTVLSVWQFLRNRRLYMGLYSAKNGNGSFRRIVNGESRTSFNARQTTSMKFLVRGFRPEENQTYIERRTRRHPFPDPEYGFVGRDLDVLGIEKRLHARGNLLLVHGMGGTGKTTLLHYLGAWWQTTRFVDQVFYFGYDEKAWTCQQIIAKIAESLLTPTEFEWNFRFLSQEAQQEVVSEKLRGERHLLILDNVGAIAGANRSMPETEREEIRRFLSGLNHGESLVLIGSRDNERELAKQTFGDNVYKLSGLRSRAGVTLSDRILERHKLSHYRQSPDFQYLLELLEGHPLAMEVILPNLEEHKPAEILKTLDEDEGRKEKDARSKSERLLDCVEYLYGNLTPEVQDIFNCLAPFTSAVNTEGLEHYARHIGQQPALAGIPSDLWPEVIQEAVRKGLLSPHPQISGILEIRPVLSHFLKSRLRTSEEDEKRQAIETAFRQYYEKLGGAVYQLMKSESTDKRALGQILIGPEFENLTTAIDFALKDHASVSNFYKVLSTFLDIGRKYELGLGLGNRVLAGLEAYPQERLEGVPGAEWVEVITEIANRQLMFRQCSEAEASYQKALCIWLQNKHYDADQIRRKSAPIYHQLGKAAQGQGEWKRAKEYFLRDLQISNEHNDRAGMGVTLHNLFHLWMAGGDRDLPQAIANVMGWAVPD